VDYDEPFANLLTQGMVLNHIYSRKTNKGGIRYFAPDEVEPVKDEAGHITGAKCLADGSAVDYQGIGTMSKSKLNGVDPQALIEQYGADTARLFMMFAAPPEQTLEWADSGVEGAHRFLKRVWNFAQTYMPNKTSSMDSLGQMIDWSSVAKPIKNQRREIHLALRQANYDMSRHQFNTVVSACMKMLNTLETYIDAREAEGNNNMAANMFVLAEGFSILLRLLSPITPHISHALWQDLGYGNDILTAQWPEPLEAALVQDEIELVIQVNGKLRGNLRVAANADKATIEQAALAHEAVQKQLAGAAAKKIIVVPGRLVNVVM
jgi:leucyl-tRNA synthetase